MRRLALLAASVSAAATFVALTAGPAHAQENERIVTFEADITVHPDGSADFVETIGYSFGEQQRHGIRRELITAQRYDDENDRHYPLTVLSVTSPDSPDQFILEERSNGRTAIRVGDPDETITGRHNYELAYRLDGVVNAQPGPDELYWNVTGDEWDVPIDSVTINVRVPNGAQRIDCFTGVVGSTRECASARIDDEGVARFEHGYVPAGEGITVVVAIPDTDGDASEPQPILAAKSIPDPFSFAEAFELTPLTVGGGAVLLALFGGLIARAQWHFGRDRRAIGAPTDIAFADASSLSAPVPLFSGDGTPVEFVPPDNIRPGQLGVLRDEVAHTRDISATIVDLAVRGYLRIEEITDDDGDVDDYRFVRLPKSGGLLDYESYLLGELFEKGPVVELSDLKNKFASSLSETKKRLYVDAVQRGWFSMRPDHVRAIWFVIGLVATAAGVGITVLLARNTSLGVLGIPFIVAGVALTIGSKWMPRRTAVGHGVYRRALGFEEFIEHSEKHRAEWAERRHLFTEYLPYAIALGATKQWARTLEALGAPPPQQSGWYVGHSMYGWAAFGDRMNNFTSSAASTLSSTPGGSGSSGFSGGSAGGGGGGGGGGSW